MSACRLPSALSILAAAIIILPHHAVMGQSADSGAPSSIHVERLGGDINTSYQEYAPSITSDGLTLYFISDRPGGRGGHDIWMATKTDRLDREFTAVRNLGEPVNTSMSEGALSAVGDDGIVYFTACNRADGLGDCDIYQARFDGTAWSDIRNVRELNSVYWDAQPSISSDGRTIVFVSERSGSIDEENIDIYIAHKDDNGLWSPPQNLGAPINTAGNENSPFIAPGSGALYFASTGHEGYGGFDFFVALKDTHDSWSAPRNLGAPINSAHDERFIAFPPSSDLLYFSSNRPARSDTASTLDLFMVRPSRPLVPLLITGRVYDRATGAGLAASLMLLDAVAGDTTIAHRTSDSATGSYTMAVAGGAVMTMMISARVHGYAPFVMTIHLPEAREYTEWRADIPLDADPAGGVQPELADPNDDVAIVPNPTSGMMVVRYTGAREEVEKELVISNLYGEEVFRTTMRQESRALDMSGLPSGLYLVRAGSVTRLMMVRK